MRLDAVSEGSPVRLHLGCGTVRLEEYVNIDVVDDEAVDLVADITSLALSEESVDEIYLNAVLEHLDWREIPSILASWRALLKPGGTLRIDSVPDFRRTAEAYLAGERGNTGSDTFDLYNVLRYTHGPYLVRDGAGLSQLHRALFDPESLGRLLADAGFVVDEIVNVRWQQEPVDNNLNVRAHRAAIGPPQFVGALETLLTTERLIRDHTVGANLRFGDGDLNLARGVPDRLQEPDPRLAIEMREALALSGPGILTCLPLHSELYGTEMWMSPGVHLWSDAEAERFWAQASTLVTATEVFSAVALHYCSVFERPAAERFLCLLRALEPVFVGNENTPPEVLTRLFGEGHRIATPSANAYSQIDRIEEELLAELDPGSWTLVVIAMGCSGRVLQKRILERGANAFLFDFGSLIDALSGQDTRTWIRRGGPVLRNLLDSVRPEVSP